MSMESPYKQLRIRENVVELDGKNIAGDLSHIEIVANGRECEAVLHLHAAHNLDLDVFADVKVATPTTAGEMQRFLASVDPAKLEQEALNRMTTGSLTSVMLDVLKEYAEDWNWEA